MATGGYGANPKMAMKYDNYWGCLNENMATTNTVLATGDGIVMGDAIGANLVGMGFAQLMPSSQPVTGSLSGGLWTSAENQVFVNQEGKRFVSEYESRDIMAKQHLSRQMLCFILFVTNPLLVIHNQVDKMAGEMILIS